MFAEVWIKRRVDLQDKMIPVLDTRRSRKVEEGQKERQEEEKEKEQEEGKEEEKVRRNKRGKRRGK